MYLYYKVEIPKVEIPNRKKENLILPRKQDIPDKKQDIFDRERNLNNPIDKKIDKKIRVSETQINPIEKIIKNPIKTSDRSSVPDSRSYLTVRSLSQKRKETKDKKEKIEINKQIRRIQDRKPNEGNDGQTKEFHITMTDLNGAVMGVIYSSYFRKDKENYIAIGDMKFINSAFFNFVQSKLQGYCTRTTAYLTEEGIQCLENYVKRYLRQRYVTLIFGNKKKMKRKSNLEIRRLLRNKNAHDLEVAGVRAHVNLKGRIEIFNNYPRLNELLCGAYNLTNRQEKRLNRLTKSTSLKMWIRETNPNFNVFVGRTFYTLSKIINEIYKKYEN